VKAFGREPRSLPLTSRPVHTGCSVKLWWTLQLQNLLTRNKYQGQWRMQRSKEWFWKYALPIRVDIKVLLICIFFFVSLRKFSCSHEGLASHDVEIITSMCCSYTPRNLEMSRRTDHGSNKPLLFCMNCSYHTKCVKVNRYSQINIISDTGLVNFKTRVKMFQNGSITTPFWMAKLRLLFNLNLFLFVNWFLPSM
jgi:hypothetical protein